MGTYNKTLLKKVQRIDLEMAVYFVEFCKKNNLLFYLCGGGCIGAIRHHGFIPWDDDLDFFLPRDDYEKLKVLWRDSDKYTLNFPSENYNDHSMFITIRDKTTTMVKPVQMGMDITHGISMDVFPLDGCPDSWVARRFQVLWALVYQLFCAQIVPENHGVIVSLIGKVGLSLVKNPSHRYKIWKYAEKQMTKYKIEDCSSITEICAGPYYMKNKYPKDCFESAVYYDFEDTVLPIPIGTDSGGIQEECPSYGVPVLVMRDTTERPEGVDAGTLRLVGTDEKTIYQAFTELLVDDEAYAKMSHASNPYGDGHACERIADVLEIGNYNMWVN